MLLRGALAVAWLMGRLAGPAWSQSLEVAPVSVTLAAGQQTAALTLTNRGRVPMTVQVRPFRWDEDGDRSTLSPTPLLLASPPAAEIAPGQSQLVRLLLRQLPGQEEGTFRLLIDQLPTARAPGQVSITLRVSLPVFSQPAPVAAPALRWQLVRRPGGALLAVRNEGGRHANVLSAELRPPAARPIPVVTAQRPYVLAGTAKQWPIDGPVRLPGAGIPLHVETDLGPLDVIAPVSDPH